MWTSQWPVEMHHNFILLKLQFSIHIVFYHYCSLVINTEYWMTMRSVVTIHRKVVWFCYLGIHFLKLFWNEIKNLECENLPTEWRTTCKMFQYLPFHSNVIGLQCFTSLMSSMYYTKSLKGIDFINLIAWGSV